MGGNTPPPNGSETYPKECSVSNLLERKNGGGQFLNRHQAVSSNRILNAQDSSKTVAVTQTVFFSRTETKIESLRKTKES